MSCIWHKTTSDGVAPILELGELGYPLITITLRSLWTWSGRAFQSQFTGQIQQLHLSLGIINIILLLLLCMIFFTCAHIQIFVWFFTCAHIQIFVWFFTCAHIQIFFSYLAFLIIGSHIVFNSILGLLNRSL